MAEQLPWVDRVNLGGGVRRSDLPLVQKRLAHLFTRLEAWPVGSVDLWLRVKNRDEAGMKTTLEVQVPSLPMLVATSKRDHLGAALDVVGDTLVQLLNETAQRYADHGTASIRR